MHFGKVGSSDILGILPGGRFLAVECKAPEGGRLSPEQRQFLDEVRALGGLSLVAKGWKDIDSALREAGYSGITDGPLFTPLSCQGDKIEIEEDEEMTRANHREDMK
jgi:hypothetical protein